MPSGRTQLVSDNLVEFAVGALATKAAEAANSKIDASREQGVKIKKLMAHMSFGGKTATEGPLVVGCAFENYTDAELAEFFLADPQKHEDPALADQANRRIVPLWVISRAATGSEATPSASDMVLKDMRIPSFEVEEGTPVKWWLFNADTSVLTTGMTLIISAQWVTEWLKD